MLTTLPYYSFKSYFANTKLYRIIIHRHANCLKTFSNEGNSQYTFKKIHHYGVTGITVIYVTLNVYLCNALLSLDIGLPKYLIGELCTL